MITPRVYSSGRPLSTRHRGTAKTNKCPRPTPVGACGDPGRAGGDGTGGAAAGGVGGWGNRPRGVCLSRPVPHVLLHTRPPLPAASSCCCFSEEIRFDILITLLPQNWFPFNPTDFFSCSVYKDHIPTKFHGLLQSWGWRWGGSMVPRELRTHFRWPSEPEAPGCGSSSSPWGRTPARPTRPPPCHRRRAIAGAPPNAQSNWKTDSDGVQWYRRA